MTQTNLASLFEEEPKQWGLRGDPLLWRELKSLVLSKEVGTASEFEILLKDLFAELTRYPPQSNTSIYIERYDRGGMSSGYVSSAFWFEKAIPLLVDRYRALHPDAETNNE